MRRYHFHQFVSTDCHLCEASLMLNLYAEAFRVSELPQSSSVSPHLQAINSSGWLNLEKYIQILTTSRQFYRSHSFLGHHPLSWFVVTPLLPADSSTVYCSHSCSGQITPLSCFNSPEALHLTVKTKVSRPERRCYGGFETFYSNRPSSPCPRSLPPSTPAPPIALPFLQ